MVCVSRLVFAFILSASLLTVAGPARDAWTLTEAASRKGFGNTCIADAVGGTSSRLDLTGGTQAPATSEPRSSNIATFSIRPDPASAGHRRMWWAKSRNGNAASNCSVGYKCPPDALGCPVLWQPPEHIHSYLLYLSIPVHL